MKILRNKNCGFHLKDGICPITRIIRAAACIIQNNILVGDTEIERVLAHGFRFVVIYEAVIPAHQQFFHFTCLIKRHRCLYTVT